MTLSLLLKCGDLDETRSYYAEILGFDVSDSAEGTCTVTKSGGAIVFTNRGLWEGRPHCTGTIYFFMQDVEQFYESVKDKAIVRWPLEDMPYGTREFGIEDCNGYTLAFARRI